MIVGIVASLVLALFAFAFPQRMKLVLAGLVIVWVGSAIAIYWETVKTGERLAKIVATAVWDETCTDPKAPLRITFKNDNASPVLKLNYTLEGFEPAFRASVAYDGYQRSNVRIAAGESYTACRAFRMRSSENAEPSGLNWVVTVNSAEFE
ncbi:hypothetical protein [Agrobacterium sp.]|uniref:hypothetical protein n=1 Tax=Agrobacterium sp. TaxID=361 RepID=UPI0028A913CC|nr:hypothetical protein [Agrobacterium sp.]